MKKLLLFFLTVIITVGVFAQAPQKMSYQAVIRDINNVLVANAPIGMQVSILQGSASGTPVYVETHTPTTNINGLATVEIGSGTVVSGSFANIDWSAGPYFIKTETDPAGGSNYSVTGTSQLLSVPYALYAENTGQMYNAGAGISISNDTIINTLPNQNQTLSLNGNDLTISSGNTVTLPGTGGNAYLSKFQQTCPTTYGWMDDLNDAAIHSATSESDGSYIYVNYEQGGTNNTVYIAKIKRDSITGQYIKNNNFSTNVRPVTISGVAVLGNYLYTYGRNSSLQYEFHQIDKVTGTITVMNVVGFLPDNSTSNNLKKVMFSDGIYVYIFNNINSNNSTWKKYSVSGTDMIDEGVFVINNFNSYPEAAIYDNGILYVSDGTINKIDFTGGQIVKTISVDEGAFAFGNVDGIAGSPFLTGFGLTDQPDVYYYLTNYWQYVNDGTSSDKKEYLHTILLPVSKP